jgi:phosphoglycolate phosphatase
VKYDAILFDLDGTLVATPDLWADAYLETLKKYGIKLEYDYFIQEFYQKSRPLQEALAELGIDETQWDEVRYARDAEYCNKLRKSTVWYDDALEMLTKLSDDTPKAIVTGSWRSYTDALHESIQLYDIFSTVITADDCDAIHKPNPHGLLLGCEKLNVDPTKCLYVGDQDFDIEAAHRAGMEGCIVSRKWTPEGASEEADIVCTELTELLEWL